MKKVFQILILTLILIIPSQVNAIDLELSHKESFEKCNDEYTTILPSYDDSGNVDGHIILYSGKYIKRANNDINDHTRLVKYGLNNKVIYSKEYDDIYSDDINFDIVEISDNNFKLVITRYGQSNKVIFEKEYTNYNIYDILDYFNSFNNKGKLDGYIAIVESSKTEVDPGFVMMKFDLNGNVVWQKNINKYKTDEGNTIIVKGNQIDSIFYIEDTTLFKISVSGEILLEVSTEIELSGINYSYNASGIIDGVVVVGTNYDESTATIIKYDLDGNEVFKTNYDGQSSFSSVIASEYTKEKYDGYIATGASEGKYFIAKYNFSGKIVWQEEFATWFEDVEYKIAENYDTSGEQNGYILYSNYEYSHATSEKCNNFTILKYTYTRYKITNQASNEGNITVNTTAYPGEIVKVNVTPRTGYSLKRIVVMTSSGNEVEVSSDGTFVMPDEEVTVLALYNKVTNPNTVSACYVILGIILLISLGTLIVTKKQEETLDQ